MATPTVIDFSGVPEDGGRTFNKKRQPAGDYRGKVLKVEDAKAKSDGGAQWLFTIQAGRGTYPYYIKLQANQYWKIRQLLKAAGVNVPSKRVKVNPDLVVGKPVAVTLEDDEYNGKEQSVIDNVFPISELEETDGIPDQSDDEEEVEEEEAPAPVAKRPPAAPVIDDDDLDELEVEDL